MIAFFQISMNAPTSLVVLTQFARIRQEVTLVDAKTVTLEMVITDAEVRLDLLTSLTEKSF